jgi:hypothetical protein
MAINTRLEREVENVLAWEKELNIPPYKVSPHHNVLKCLPKAIVSCAADKNLGLVLLNLFDYDVLVAKHLDVSEDYRVLDENEREILIPTLRAQHKELLLRIQEVLTNESQAFKFLSANTGYQVPKFHVLPKLHKWNNDNVLTLPTRPIAGAVNWVTTRWSQWLGTVIDDEIRMPHVLKDSRHLVQVLSQFRVEFQGPVVLFTADADALYTNMDVNELLCIVDEFNPWLTQFVAFVLNNSYVEYRGKIYRQLRGIPMGTNSAVHLANMYLDSLIDNGAATHEKVLFYRRYIDDCFGIFQGSVEEARAVLPRLLDRSLLRLKWNFAIEQWEPGMQSRGMPFLDLSLWLDESGAVKHCPYVKPTNKGLYLPFRSCHPRPVMRGFIRGESIRLCCLSSTEDAYNLALKGFWRALKARGYPNKFLRAVNIARYCDRAQYVFPPENPRKRDGVAPFKLQYSNRACLPALKAAVSKLNNMEQVKRLNIRLLTAYKRPPNVQRFICHSALSTAQENELNRAKRAKIAGDPQNIEKSNEIEPETDQSG